MMKQKAFFIICKQLLLKQIKDFFKGFSLNHFLSLVFQNYT